LQNWLFPADERQARDIRTLQVSFGSNDEFFASDKHSKISYRDSISPPPSSLANVVRGVVRKKAFTVSSPSLGLGLGLMEVRDGKAGVDVDEMKSGERRIERRKTYMDRQSNSISREDSISSPYESRVLPREEANWDTKHERKRSIFPVCEGQLKRLNRRSTLFEERPGPTSEEAHTANPSVESSVERGRPRPLSPTHMDTRSDTTKQQRRRSLLVNTLPVRATWPDTKTILRAKLRIKASTVNPKADHTPGREVTSPNGNAGIQTSERANSPMQDGKPMTQYDFSPHQYIAIGAMSEFFRCQYRLGDALAFV
ncbi:hypothetical protein IFR05_016345, partial [Cadophora sp. M221]